jgi:hypothetical protein
MKNWLVLGLVAGLFAACGDPCDDVACYNSGYCVEGTCNCPVGAEGADCSDQTRMRYIGIYTGTYIEDGVSFPQSSITVSVVLSDPIVRMDIGEMTVDLTTETVFTVYNQYISGSNPVTIQSGNGTCNGTTLNYNISFNGGGSNHTASFSGTHQ